MLIPQFWLAFLCLSLPTIQTENLDLAIIVDVSHSMAEPGKFIREGAHLATFELGPGDRAFVASFWSRFKSLTGFTSDSKQIEAALKNAKPPVLLVPGKHCVHDALFEAIRQFPNTISSDRKRAIIVITNEADDGSVHTPEEVIQQANARRIALWVCLIGNPYAHPAQLDLYRRIPYPNVVLAEKQLRPLATETGGRISVYEMNGYVLRKAIAACKGDGK